MKKGRIKGDEVTNRPLSALFESKMAQKPEFTGFEGRDSMVFQANGPSPMSVVMDERRSIPSSRTAS